MNDNIIGFLQNLGYKVNTNSYYVINECNNWYANRYIPGFHNRMTIQGDSFELQKMNFAKRGCCDEANLCEVIEINAGQNETQNKQINDILKDNRFNVMYREQLEKNCAVGTVACYIRLDDAQVYDDGTIKNGNIRLNYVDANGFIPLTIINDEIIEAAFYGENIVKGEKQTTLVIFTLMDGSYQVSTYVFNANDEIISDPNLASVQLGDVKPFAIMRNADVNNLDNMQGFGLPKIWNAIPILKALDLSFNVMFNDIDKAEKIILINELMCEFGSDGKPLLNEQQKRLFCLLGEKLPDQANLIQEYNPTIRIDEITKVYELLLSLFSMSFGFGAKKYTFDNGQIKTATEAIIENQASMQQLNKQRQQSKQYIQDICKAVIWFSNTFKGTSFNIDDEILISFDDSIITDRQSDLDSKRNDALSFAIPKLTIWYLMDKYNLNEQEATTIYNDKQSVDEPIEPLA